MFKWNDTLTLCWNNLHQIENDKKNFYELSLTMTILKWKYKNDMVIANS